MSSRLGRAMEKMGWKVPEDEYEADDYTVEAEAEVHEYPFSRYQAEEPASAARAQNLVRTDVAVTGGHTELEASERQRIATVHPRNYADALIIGESFRAGTPVIMNLTDMDDAEARRIIDFAAGLTVGLYGSLERVTTRVFLLSPESVEVTHDRAGTAPALYR